MEIKYVSVLPKLKFKSPTKQLDLELKLKFNEKRLNPTNLVK